MNTKKFKEIVFAAAAIVVGGFVFAKTEVSPPTFESAFYNGSVQTASVPPSDKWQVMFSESGEHVGAYDVFLRLVDSDNYKWAGSDDRMIAVPFTISQAQNVWTAGPSIAGWTFGDTPSVPVATAKFGAVRPIVYSGTTVDGVLVSGAAAVSEAGDYTATFDVAGTDDYTALRQEVPFSISRYPVAGNNFVVSVGANPKYNGAKQTLRIVSVTVNGAAIPYIVTGNKATHAGTYTLSVAARGNYTGTTNIVWKILPRSVTLTSGSASRAYNGTALTKNAVAVSGDGFVGSEGATYSVTGSRTDAGTSDNAFTYALKSGTSAGDYRISTVKGTLTVTKATNGWTTQPSVSGKTYDGTAVSVDKGVAKFGTSTVSFSPGGSAAPKDAGSYTATFSVSGGANYTALSKNVSVAIAPRDISNALIGTIPDQTETGSAVRPTVTVNDGTPSIITKNDYTVTYSNNVNPGTATVTLTGKRNYTGTKSVKFTIKPAPVSESATLSGEVS